MPISNIPSVLEHGLLSHNRAALLPHSDISMAEIQDEREGKQVPGGRKLHDYANTYFHARNPMMYNRQDQRGELCILSISKKILEIPECIVTDQNAASNYVRYYEPHQINEDNLDFDKIYAESWQHDDQIEHWKRKSRKCAEVLVPDMIAVDYIQRAYVVNEAIKTSLQKAGFSSPIELNPHLFFQ